MTSNNDLILILGGVILVGIILFIYQKMNKGDWIPHSCDFQN